MTKKKSYKYVFGPVPSRRLGHSLGIDLVPFKTCTYDCIYCQLGPTTGKTIERKEYFPTEEVLAEIEEKLAEGPRPDYLTLTGSGEPTLHSRIGEAHVWKVLQTSALHASRGMPPPPSVVEVALETRAGPEKVRYAVAIQIDKLRLRIFKAEARRNIPASE